MEAGSNYLCVCSLLYMRKKLNLRREWSTTRVGVWFFATARVVVVPLRNNSDTVGYRILHCTHPFSLVCEHECMSLAICVLLPPPSQPRNNPTFEPQLNHQAISSPFIIRSRYVNGNNCIMNGAVLKHSLDD